MNYEGRAVLVAGVGVAGRASAQVLLERGARVSVLDPDGGPNGAQLREAGATVFVGEQVPPLAGLDDVVVSPGIAPRSALVRAAVAAGLPVYSEPELAWRLRPAGAPVWLGVTGTNGKTTTVTMLAAMLAAGGLRTAALGNIGEPLVFAAADPGRFDVLAVELSSFQLYYSRTLAPRAGALLNLAEDHLEWHTDFAEYATSKLAVWRAATPAGAADGPGTAVGNLDDPRVAGHLARADVTYESRRVGVTVGEPEPGQLGVADGVLVDRAFAPEPVELIAADRIRLRGVHNLSNALHAAALARAYGVSPRAVGQALAGYEPQPHRNALVATVAGVAYVDDSKATNPHAALASLLAYPRVIWVAGGQLKGVDIADLVAAVADRLAGAVLLGVDREQVARALRRHAPRVPVVEVSRTDDGAMTEVVAAAAALARTGDTVLLAPAAASKDMFASYDQRGAAFAAAVRALGPAGS